MNGPNEALMDAYGTRDLLEEKNAEMSPWVPRVIAGLGAVALLSSMQGNRDESLRQDQDRQEMRRELEAAKMQQTTNNLRHTSPAFIIPQGYDVPVGLDQGMVRMAAAIGAGLAGSELAKEAGIGEMASNFLGSAGKAVGGAVSAAKNALGTIKMPPLPKPGAISSTAAAAGAPAAAAAGKAGGGLLGKLPGVGLKGQLGLAAGAAAAVYGGGKIINGVSNYAQKEPSGPSVWGAGQQGAQVAHTVGAYGQPQVGM